MKNKLHEIETQVESLHYKLAEERTNWMESHKNNFMENWDEFENLGKETINEISKLQNKMELMAPVKLEKWDGVGDIMTINEWLENVVDDGFIDYDGYGYYSVDGKKSNKPIYPSDVDQFPMRDKEFTHIIWYNR